MSMARTIEERVTMVQLFSIYENAHEIQRLETSCQHVSSSFGDDYACEPEI